MHEETYCKVCRSDQSETKSEEGEVVNLSTNRSLFSKQRFAWVSTKKRALVWVKIPSCGHLHRSTDSSKTKYVLLDECEIKTIGNFIDIQLRSRGHVYLWLQGKDASNRAALMDQKIKDLQRGPQSTVCASFYINPSYEQVSYHGVSVSSSKKMVALNKKFTEEKKFAECDGDSNTLKPGEECYMIHKTWWKQWKDQCSSVEVSNSSNSSCKPSGINNNDLIAESGLVNGSIKIGIDCHLVTRQVWEFLFSIYGGGPVIYFNVRINLSCNFLPISPTFANMRQFLGTCSTQCFTR